MKTFSRSRGQIGFISGNLGIYIFIPKIPVVYLQVDRTGVAVTILCLRVFTMNSMLLQPLSDLPFMGHSLLYKHIAGNPGPWMPEKWDPGNGFPIAHIFTRLK